jgi:hypothetical protein
MMRVQRGIVGLAAALIACWGCGGGGAAPSVSSSTEEATVTGTVIVKGQPASGAEITFDPSNVNRPMARPQAAKIDSDGKFTVKTLAGENSVTVHGPAIDRDPGLSTNSRVVDVKAGANVAIELP